MVFCCIGYDRNYQTTGLKKATRTGGHGDIGMGDRG